MNPLIYLFLAYLIFLAAFFVFLFRLAHKVRRLEEQVNSLDNSN